MQDRWRKFVVPAAAGMLLVPAAAIAGVRMIATAPPDETPETVLEPVAAPTHDDRLTTACGPDAASLVSRETAGTIDPIGRAALDALRPICERAGRPLPPAPVPGPIVVEERVEVPVPVAPPTIVTVAPAAVVPGVVGPSSSIDGGPSHHPEAGDHDDRDDDEGDDRDRDRDDEDDDRDDEDDDRDDDQDDAGDDDQDDAGDDDRDDDGDDE